MRFLRLCLLILVLRRFLMEPMAVAVELGYDEMS